MELKPHKWAKEIKAWADGRAIQIRNPGFYNPTWTDCNAKIIHWEDEDHEFRIKPKETRIELENGKYTVIHEEGQNFHAAHYGERWRDLCGDNLVMALVNRIEELEEQVKPKQVIGLTFFEIELLLDILFPPKHPKTQPPAYNKAIKRLLHLGLIEMSGGPRPYKLTNKGVRLVDNMKTQHLPEGD